MTLSMLILDQHLLLLPTWTPSSLTSKPCIVMPPWAPKFKLRETVTTPIMLVKPGKLNLILDPWVVPSRISLLQAHPMPISLSIFAKILNPGESLALLGWELSVDPTLGKDTKPPSTKREVQLSKQQKSLLMRWVTIWECFTILMTNMVEMVVLAINKAS